MLSNTGTLYIISAPSGGGKTSLVRALLDTMSGIEVSVSYTTRQPRLGDREGVDYFFVSEEAFFDKRQQGDFLETALVFQYYYGTSISWVEKKLAQGIDIILEIDWQGARAVREAMPGTVSIFIVPPSIEELSKRLRGRGQDDTAVINHRMEKACAECEHFDEYDYLVVNDDFDESLCHLQSIIRCSRLKMAVQAKKNESLLEELLKKQ